MEKPSNRPIEFLHIYPFSPKELKDLDEDVAAALSVLSFAVTEINTFMKLCLFSVHNFGDGDAIDIANATQQFILLRTWSAKLFELVDFLKFKGRNNKTKSKILLEWKEKFEGAISELTKEDNLGYKAARNLRHQASNHYCLKPAKDNLEFVSERANINFFFHKMQGNSFYPLGEEVIFVARLSRQVGEAGSLQEKIQLHEEWRNWNKSFSVLLQKLFSEFVSDILNVQNSDKFARTEHYYLSPEMVGTIENRIPLFFRKD